MKKIMAIIATVMLTITMLCSVAFADSIYPAFYDLKVNARKADPANVKKDGVIGENEYDELDFDNKWLTINVNAEDDEKRNKAIEDANKVRESVKFYFSWDETNGLNLAVQYKPIKWGVNEYKAETHDEYILFTKSGGLLLEVFDSANPQAPVNGNGMGLYMGLSQNKNGELLYCGYSNQTGFANGWCERDGKNGYFGDYKPDDKNACVKYDEATGIVTYEWSIPVNQLMFGEEKTMHINLAVQGALSEKTGEWSDSNGCWSLNLGTWGFYAGQGALAGHNLTEISLSNEAVGYVEPIETPTPPAETPTPTVKPDTTPEAKPSTDSADNGWMLWVMIVEAVVIVALVAVVVMKKKK